MTAVEPTKVHTNRRQRNPSSSPAGASTDPTVPVHVFPHKEIQDAKVTIHIPHPKSPGKITYLEGKIVKVPSRLTNTLVISVPGLDNTPLKWVEKAASNGEDGDAAA